jgi:hypothetical protein
VGAFQVGFTTKNGSIEVPDELLGSAAMDNFHWATVDWPTKGVGLFA